MTAEATLTPTTEAGQALLRKARTVDGWHTNFDAGDILDIEREAAAAAVERINDQWDALIAQRVAGNITDLGVIQAMNGIFDATPLHAPDPRLTEQESRP